MTTTVDVVNYQYDDANRLVLSKVEGLASVNGQAYTWDDNGNLLSDGLRSYTYTHANRLTQVVSGTLTTQFVYNGAGDRVARTVDGVTISYLLDPAADLTQVLQETTGGQTTNYLYGADLLAQYDSGTWAYHLNDGLGSVRQLADPAGQVVQGYSFSPFGVPLGESGGEPYGYTGEQWDGEVELLYLRARYYVPEMGRFISKDPFPGYADSPQSLNWWVYVQDNPISVVDPSGLLPPPPYVYPPGPVRPEDLVTFFKDLWSKRGLLRDCSKNPDDGQHPWDTVDDILTDFICEYGPETRVFREDAYLTKELAASHSMSVLREELYQSGKRRIDGWVTFLGKEFFWATVDSGMPFKGITHFLGSYYYDIRKVHSNSKIRFFVRDKKNRETGSRIPGRFSGVSLEEALTDPSLASQPIKSFLKAKTREETTGLEGGGAMTLIFIWFEPYQSSCSNPVMEAIKGLSRPSIFPSPIYKQEHGF